MVFRFTMIAAIVFALLAGCTKSGSNDMKEQVQDVSNEVKDTATHVWKTQVDSLDKAKRVEQNLMDAAEEQRRAIDRESE